MTTGEFSGQRVLVMGLGRFGGGVGAARWLAAQGASVTVTDQAPAESLAESVNRLQDLAVSFALGAHPPELLDNADLLVVNPAVHKVRSEFFQRALRKGIPWTTELNLFVERCPARIVGVTGSAGKSTTCAMIHEILSAAAGKAGISYRQVYLGGNIGHSLLGDLNHIDADDIVVLELSSFQLEDLAALARSPHMAVVTNLSPNHLDRHGTMAAYRDAKSNIFRCQSAADRLVYWDDASTVSDWIRSARPRAALWPFKTSERGIEWFNPKAESVRTLPVRLRIPGGHNRLNAAAAAAAADGLDIDSGLCAHVLESFRGLPHRMEYVREYRGAHYYNDSKSTSPRMTMTAMEALDRPVVLLAGGRNKQMSIDELAGAAVRRCRAVVCFGEVGAELHAACLRHGAGGDPAPVRLAEDVLRAVELARGLARPGDAVVLSPGFTSYDEFTNFEKRGERFRRIVESWA